MCITLALRVSLSLFSMLSCFYASVQESVVPGSSQCLLADPRLNGLRELIINRASGPLHTLARQPGGDGQLGCACTPHG